MVNMSTPTPADVMRRRPAGSPTGGRFVEKRNTEPAGQLAPNAPIPNPNDLPGANLVEEIPEYVTTADTAMRAQYRDLWKRLNAKHRSTTYGTAGVLSVSSEDPAELAVLAQFAADGIAVNVARNPHTPSAVLHMLAVGESDFRDPDARRAAVMHPNCSEETIRLVWAHRRTLNFEGTGRDVVTSAPNTPVDVLEEAALEGDDVATARLLAPR